MGRFDTGHWGANNWYNRADAVASPTDFYRPEIAMALDAPITTRYVRVYWDWQDNYCWDFWCGYNLMVSELSVIGGASIPSLASNDYSVLASYYRIRR